MEKGLRCTSAYCIGLRTVLLKDGLIREASTVATMAGLGFRHERSIKDARDDRRWKRREQTLNRGRNMISENVAFANLSAGIFGDLGRQAGEGAAGALYYLGYTGERNTTIYPTMTISRTTREPQVQAVTG